jgi:protein phosphatase
MLTFQADYLTDTGQMREENEDCAWSQVRALAGQPPLGLFIVCDGMGGHMGGKFASYWAVEAVKAEFSELFSSKDPRATLVLGKEDVEAVKEGSYVPPKPIQTGLEALTLAAIQKANKVVHEYATHKPKQAANAGTTLTMLAARGEQALFANAGDSRAYLVRDHELKQITRDHSLVANLVAEGQILPDEIYDHPQRNMIYRFLGQKGMVQPDLFWEKLQAGDQVLLCSDGLWEMVRSKQRILDTIEAAEDARTACQELVEMANELGGEDNISVVVLRVE